MPFPDPRTYQVLLFPMFSECKFLKNVVHKKRLLHMESGQFFN